MTEIDRGTLLDRQVVIIPRKLQYSDVLLVGAGMVGSWTALALARVVSNVHVWDYDKVEAENVGCQAYTGVQVGVPKVEALADLGVGLPIVPFNEKFPCPEMSEGEITSPLICSVDTIESRKEIAEWCQENSIPLFIDTRVIGEQVFLVVVDGTKGRTYKDYIKDLPKDEDVPDATCGMVGTAYVGMFTACQVLTTLCQWASDKPVPYLRGWDVRFSSEYSRKETVRG